MTRRDREKATSAGRPRESVEDAVGSLAKAMLEYAQQFWISSASATLKMQRELGRPWESWLRGAAIPTPSRSPESDRGGNDEAAESLQPDSVQQLAERAFKSRLKPMLARRDVANRAEIEALTREVEALTHRVEAICREREQERSSS